MHSETLSAPAAADLRPTPQGTYGADSPDAPPKKPKGVSGQNQYGTRHLEDCRYMDLLEAFREYLELDRTKQTAHC